MTVRKAMLYPVVLFTFIGIIADEDYIVYVNDSSTHGKGKCGDIRAPCQDIDSALHNISSWKYTEGTAWVHIQQLDNCTFVNLTESLLDEKTHRRKVARRSIGFRGGNMTMTPTRPICKIASEESPWLLLEECTSVFDLHLVDLVFVNGSSLFANCSQTRLNMRNVTVQEGRAAIANLQNNATTIADTTFEAWSGIAVEKGLVDISGLNATALWILELVNISDLTATSRLDNSWLHGIGPGILISGKVAGFAMENVQASNISQFEMFMSISSFAHPYEAYSDGLRMVNTNIEANRMQINLTNDGSLELQNVNVITNTGILNLEYKGAKTKKQIRNGGDGMISNITNCNFKSSGHNNELLHINLVGQPSSKADNQLSVHNLTLVHTTMKMDLQGNQAYLGGLQYELLDGGADPLLLNVSLAKLAIQNSTIKACQLEGEVDILSISGSDVVGDYKLSAREGKDLNMTLSDSTIDVNALLTVNRLKIHRCVFTQRLDVNATVLDISKSRFLEGGSLIGIQVSVSDSTWNATGNGQLLIRPVQDILNGTATLKNITVSNIRVNVHGFNETRISGKLESMKSAYFKPGYLSELDIALTNISKDVRFEQVTPNFGSGKILVSNVRNLFFDGKVDLEAVAPPQPKFNLTSLKLNNTRLEGTEALSENGTYKGKKLDGFILQKATNLTLQVWRYGKGPFEKKAFKYWGYIIAGLVFVIVCCVGACYCNCCKDDRKYSSHEVGTGYRLNTSNAHTSGTMGPSR